MAGKIVDEIFGDKLKDATGFQAAKMASMALINDGKGHYSAEQLPAAFQWTPIFPFDINDYNNDGIKDILAGGNFFGTTPYEGRYDAMPLAVGLGNGRGSFKPILPLPAYLEIIRGEIRSIQTMNWPIIGKGCYWRLITTG